MRRQSFLRTDTLKEETHSVYREVSLFIDSIKRGGIVKPLASREDGRIANQIVESAHKSIQAS